MGIWKSRRIRRERHKRGIRSLIRALFGRHEILALKMKQQSQSFLRHIWIRQRFKQEFPEQIGFIRIEDICLKRLLVLPLAVCGIVVVKFLEDLVERQHEVAPHVLALVGARRYELPGVVAVGREHLIAAGAE